MGWGGFDLQTDGLDPIYWIAIVLAGLTGFVHLALGIGAFPDPLGVAALLAAGGYAGAIVLVLVNYRRRLILALGIPFVGSQILLWYLLNRPTSLSDISPIAAVDKLVQVLLIVAILVLLNRESQ